MIASRTIQQNGDRMYDISFILLGHNEENDQKVRFRDLNAETKPKIKIYAKNWVRQVLLKYFDLVKVNSQWSGQVNGQRMTWQCDVTLGLTLYYVKRSRHVWRVEVVCPSVWRIRTTHGGVWSACSWGRNFNRRMGARVRWFLAFLSWVLLGIACSVTLCLCFDSWMSRMMRSESC